MILTSCANIFLPPSLWLDSWRLARVLVVDLCVWLHKLLDKDSMMILGTFIIVVTGITGGQFRHPLYYCYVPCMGPPDSRDTAKSPAMHCHRRPLLKYNTSSTSAGNNKQLKVLLKMKSFSKLKDTVNKKKWQSTKWEKFFTNPKSHSRVTVDVHFLCGSFIGYGVPNKHTDTLLFKNL